MQSEKNDVVIEKKNYDQIHDVDDFDFAEEVIEHQDLSENKGLSLEDMERKLIKQTLDKYKGRRKSAAEELKISERTLYRKIKEYGLE